MGLAVMYPNVLENKNFFAKQKGTNWRYPGRHAYYNVIDNRLSASAGLYQNVGENVSNTYMTGIAVCNYILNEEFLVSASHHLALITSLSFVHTARRSYRLDSKVNLMDSNEKIY